MNIFYLIQPNPFLSSIYPNGIVGEILVGNIEFTSGGHVFLTIHTKNCPQKEVKKWGEFGNNYNTVSLKLSMYNAESTSISG
ncbi:hypothetical protein [Vibrio metschnikovii]|uniref:hypothetical protein n=1 Tax=Vibrio metschnikovii TaxID=28172 RepID=UPI002FC7EC1E